METRVFNDLSNERKQHFHSEYTVGWVCALPREQSAASFMLDDIHDPGELANPVHDNNAYIRGSIGGHNIVIACLPMGLTGTSSAASVATRMIATFVNIKFGLMVGIGGGMPQNNVRLGDVVVSSPKGKSPGVVQWDFGKAESGGTFRRTGSLDKPPTALLTALGNVRSDSIKSYAEVEAYLRHLETRSDVPKSFVSPDMLTDVLYKSSYPHVEKILATGGDYWETQMKDKQIDCALCDKTMTVEREPKIRNINYHYGLIASGNQVIKDALVRNSLYDDLYEDLDTEVLCVEMEAAGLMNDFPCLVIRGICDYADSHKNDAWQDYAACVAAAFAKVLLSKLPATDVDKMTTIQDLLPRGFVEKAKEVIKPWLYLDHKARSPTDSTAIDKRQVQPRDGCHDQTNRAADKSISSHGLASTDETIIINTQPYPEGRVSGEYDIVNKFVSSDNDNAGAGSLKSVETNPEMNVDLDRAHILPVSQIMKRKSQPDGIIEEKNDNFKQDKNQLNRFLGQTTRQINLKRLLLDTVELIR